MLYFSVEKGCEIVRGVKRRSEKKKTAGITEEERVVRVIVCEVSSYLDEGVIWGGPVWDLDFGFSLLVSRSVSRLVQLARGWDRVKRGY